MAERVLIVTNDGKDADYAITNQVKEYLSRYHRTLIMRSLLGVTEVLLRWRVLCVAEMSRFWESIWEH